MDDEPRSPGVLWLGSPPYYLYGSGDLKREAEPVGIQGSWSFVYPRRRWASISLMGSPPCPGHDPRKKGSRSAAASHDLHARFSPTQPTGLV